MNNVTGVYKVTLTIEPGENAVDGVYVESCAKVNWDGGDIALAAEDGYTFFAVLPEGVSVGDVILPGESLGYAAKDFVGHYFGSFYDPAAGLLAEPMPLPEQESVTAVTDEEFEQLKLDTQRALDIQAVENIMNRHVLYHCYGEHIEEMEEIWVQDPVNQATASFGQNQGYYVGYDAIYEAYAAGHWNNWLSSAKRFCEQNGIDTTGMTNDEIIDAYGGVGQLLLHVTTTAIIEIAADGKTAKGYWYSPGMIAESGSSANSIWEAYGCDFVKEDGEWKMWHLHMYTDFMCQFGESFTGNSGASGGPSGSGEQGGQVSYEGEEGAKELALSALEKGDYLYLTQYTEFSTSRLRQEMEVVPIPMPYDTWDFDVPNYGPAAEQLARYGLDVNDWYAVYGG